MAACGQGTEINFGDKGHSRVDSDFEDNKEEEPVRVGSARFDIDELGIPEKMIIQVRVLEAAGLTRHTNFSIKHVTMPEAYCTGQIINATGKTTTTKPQKTRPFKSSAFPLWDEVWAFNIHDDDLNSDKVAFKFQVVNCKKGGSNNLGELEVSMEHIVNRCYDSPDNSFNDWFKLNNRQSDAAGKIFLAFKAVDKEKLNKKIVPPLRNVESKEEEEVGIYVGTMNCGNAKPPKNLEDWLHPRIKDHQLVVVGCQECAWKDENKEEQIWEDAILKAINGCQRDDEKNEYVCVTRRSLAEMRIYCFADQKSLDKHKVSHVSEYFEATGIGGVLGNKGGTIISLDFGGTSFCFANSHLAAHQKKEHWDRRNLDFKAISESAKVGNIKQDMLEQFHHVFWMGDLNYRCDYHQMEDPKMEPPKELFDEYVRNIKNGDYLKMLPADQLSRSRDIEKPECFFGFSESSIGFQPTFKVYVDKDYEYQPKRSPSWCDRIMWRSAPCFEKDVRCEKYLNAPKICSSDHKPVFGEYFVRTWERAPGNVDDGFEKKAKAMIEFRNVKALGLRSADIGSKSDPYIHFPRQELLKKFRKSDRVKGSNDPVWTDKQLPSLNLIRTNLAYLKDALLLVQCRDFDRFSAADKLASTYLPLAPVVAEPNEWKKFDRTMTYEGLGAGTLQGEYRLII